MRVAEAAHHAGDDLRGAPRLALPERIDLLDAIGRVRGDLVPALAQRRGEREDERCLPAAVGAVDHDVHARILLRGSTETSAPEVDAIQHAVKVGAQRGPERGVREVSRFEGPVAAGGVRGRRAERALGGVRGS